MQNYIIIQLKYCQEILFLFRCNLGGGNMNADYEKQLGNNIRKIRENKNMTQEQLAAKLQINGCDITRSAIAKIEVGQRHIYPDEIKLIKEILDTEFDTLFYGS